MLETMLDVSPFTVRTLNSKSASFGTSKRFKISTSKDSRDTDEQGVGRRLISDKGRFCPLYRRDEVVDNVVNLMAWLCLAETLGL
jgi:hypothetical protein